MLGLSNIILILLNVLIFIIFQTIFFYFVGSKQLDIIISDKVDIINSYISKNSAAKEELKAFISTDEISKTLESAEIDENNRISENFKLIGMWIGIPCGIILLLLAICVSLMFAFRIQWTGIDNVGLLLIVTAYLTEIILYFGVIKKYNFIGDQKLYYFIYKLFSKEIKNILKSRSQNDSQNNSQNNSQNYTDIKIGDINIDIDQIMEDIGIEKGSVSGTYDIQDMINSFKEYVSSE